MTALSRPIWSQLPASAVAGPSRFPLSIPQARSLATEASTTPPPTAPARNPRKRTNKLAVRTSKPMSSVLHAYAVLRSIEDNYGPVLDFEVAKDPDSLRPASLLFFTMCDSIDMDTSRLLEIPAPRSSQNELERYGGPSLGDVMSVLRSDPSQAAKGQDQVITFEVEARRKKSSNHTPAKLKRPTRQSIKQDIRLAEALEKFDGGFFGAFAGLGARYKPLFEKVRQDHAEAEKRVRAAKTEGMGDQSGERSVDESASREEQRESNL